MTEINRSAPILVTGASGYIASWIVKYLLDDGYTVHGTVRDLSSPVKIPHLIQMAKQAKGSLKLFEADLLRPGSFAEAMQSCELVIHTASPFQPRVKQAKKELIDPALEGTRNILQTANELATVRRVVLTSSMAAIMGDAVEVEDTIDGTFSEYHWNLTSDLNHLPFSFSKTLAEKEAWRINQEQSRWDMVVLNPALVLGPSLSYRTDSFSTRFLMSMAKGQMWMGLPDTYLGLVDVRDVASAHLKAGFISSASGRHILCAEVVPMLAISQHLRSVFGRKFNLPKRILPDWVAYLVGSFTGMSWRFLYYNLGYAFQIDNTYSKKDLGMEYRPLLETLVDHVKNLEQKNLL